MKCIIPFEGKVKFDYQVKEINSISLEHEYTINNEAILGNFLIMGTCKEHQLSVNTTEFKFTLPFDLTLPDNIDFDSIEFNIDNFTYDLEDNYLNINIDYIVKANDIEDRSDVLIENINDVEDEVKEEIVDTLEVSNDIEKDDIRLINSFSFEDDYECFKIHIVKENDTIESICTMYNLDKEYFISINKINNISIGDKLIIPEYEDR